MSYHKDTVIFSDSWFRKDLKIRGLPEPCYLLVDKPGIFSETLPNVYIQLEPNIILNFEDSIIANKHRYHTIFATNQKILDRCENAVRYVCGTTWIPIEYYNSVDTSKKQFKISALASNKYFNGAPGHLFRQVIHHNQPRLTSFPFTFYRSSAFKPPLPDYGGNPFLGESKLPLFDTFQFALVIENMNTLNCFTEKIMDCLLTKTIPIYWGCPNIDQFFDTTGWIILSTTTLEELIDKLQILDESYYAKYTEIIDKNHTTAQQWVSFYENVSKAAETHSAT